MRMRVQQFVLWLPPLAWAALILLSSGDGGSSSVTERLVRTALEPLGVRDEDVVLVANFIFRKSIHVVAFGILGALNFRAIRGLRGGWRGGWAFAAVALAGVVAGADEWRQGTFANRTGSFGDVTIDLCGATLAQLLMRRGK